MRDREHGILEPPRIFRIAVLGDSFSEALQVPAENTFWAVLEKELAKRPHFSDHKIEVLNFGVGGYGTAQELVALREQVWKYDPDLVLLAFCTENDVFNNVRELNPTRADQAPYFVYEKGRLVYQDPLGRFAGWRRTLLDWRNRIVDLSTRLRIVQNLNSLLRNRKLRVEKENRRLQLAAAGIEDPAAAPYLPPRDPLMEQAWRITEDLILMTRDEVRAHGAEFLLVTLTRL